jgi:hypothetical protein
MGCGPASQNVPPHACASLVGNAKTVVIAPATAITAPVVRFVFIIIDMSNLPSTSAIGVARRVGKAQSPGTNSTGASGERHRTRQNAFPGAFG